MIVTYSEITDLLAIHHKCECGAIKVIMVYANGEDLSFSSAYKSLDEVRSWNKKYIIHDDGEK